MTTTLPSPLVEGPYASCALPTFIDLMGGSNGELRDLTDRLTHRATAYGVEVSTEKSKIVTNSTNNIGAGINMNGQKLEDVTSIKYLGATLCNEGTC